MTARTDDDLRDLARTVHVLAIGGLIAIAVLIGVNHVVAAVRAYLGATGELGERLRAAAPALATMVPLVLFADAANRFRRAFALFADGRYFEAGAARLVRDAGVDVAWAIAAAALLVPNLLRWIARDPGGLVLHVDGETVALFGFALFVVAMGRVLEQAAALKADHDAIV